VRTDALEALGVRPGRWLNALKDAVRGGAGDDTPIEIAPGDRRPLGELRHALLVETPGQKIVYVVDTLFSPANARAIVRLAAGATVFFCEAPFLEEDVDQATRRYHLTARQAGALARAAGVRRLEVFHFSPRYEGRYGDISSRAVRYAMASWSPEARAFLEAHRVGHLATTSADGDPHVVPVCYAVDDAAVYFVADEKPKRGPARALTRLRNLRENPRAALVVDDWSEDWTRLAWVLVRGAACVVTPPTHAHALALLRTRYTQYRRMPLDDPARNPVVAITPERVTVWRAASRGG
jgi:PPOX class probable F420-dependent enzyme